MLDSEAARYTEKSKELVISVERKIDAATAQVHNIFKKYTVACCIFCFVFVSLGCIEYMRCGLLQSMILVSFIYWSLHHVGGQLKMAERIDVLFGVETLGYSRNIVLYGIPIPYSKGVQCGLCQITFILADCFLFVFDTVVCLLVRVSTVQLIAIWPSPRI